MSRIADIFAREIMDSRGNPTSLTAPFIWVILRVALSLSCAL